MKYKYRGQLSKDVLKKGKMVDIFDFEEEFAICDHGRGNIHIDDFNCIYVSTDIFKKEILGLEAEEIEIVEEKVIKKKPIKKG